MPAFFQPLCKHCRSGGVNGLAGSIATTPVQGSAEYALYHAYQQAQNDPTAPRETFAAFVTRWCKSSLRCQVQGTQVLWAAGEERKIATMTSTTQIMGDGMINPAAHVLNTKEQEALVKRAAADAAAGGTVLAPYQNVVASAQAAVAQRAAAVAQQAKDAAAAQARANADGSVLQAAQSFMRTYWWALLPVGAGLAYLGYKLTNKSEAQKAASDSKVQVIVQAPGKGA